MEAVTQKYKTVTEKQFNAGRRACTKARANRPKLPTTCSACALCGAEQSIFERSLYWATPEQFSGSRHYRICNKCYNKL